MSRINDVIGAFGGRQHRSCYDILRTAIEVSVRHQPERPQMKVIWVEVCECTGVKPQTVARALARAVDDLWKYGDARQIVAYCQCWERYQPTPQEFIFIVSRRLWNESKADDV